MPFPEKHLPICKRKRAGDLRTGALSSKANPSVFAGDRSKPDETKDDNCRLQENARQKADTAIANLIADVSSILGRPLNIPEFRQTRCAGCGMWMLVQNFTNRAGAHCMM
jgi:hypothetical protein